jgi:hypothetical protein
MVQADRAMTGMTEQKTWIAAHGRCVIQHDPLVGFYLLVFEGETCVADYLQDTFEQALKQAETDFGIARQDWADA